jgi:hypothetical protein
MRAGYVSYLALLSAEQAYQQAVINLVQAQANRYADTAALFQALGGGWWNRADVPRVESVSSKTEHESVQSRIQTLTAAQCQPRNRKFRTPASSGVEPLHAEGVIGVIDASGPGWSTWPRGQHAGRIDRHQNSS